jgi:hypothetical protein
MRCQTPKSATAVGRQHAVQVEHRPLSSNSRGWYLRDGEPWRIRSMVIDNVLYEVDIKVVTGC